MFEITEWACRTVDALKGEQVHPARSRSMAETTVDYYNRIYATRNTYTGRAELVYRAEDGEWVEVP